MSMDLYQLRTFCIVAEEENISRASERLYLSAPSVSGHIKALEDELGVELFARSSRGMALTEAGHRLWEDADALLKQAALLRRRASQYSTDLRGVLRIGINNPPESLHIPELIANMGAQYPDLRFEYIYGSTQFILSGLRQETLDVGFVESKEPSSDILEKSLEKRPIHLIAPKNWSEELKTKSPAELQQIPWLFASEGCSLYRFAKAWCHSHGITIEPRIQSDNTDHTTVGFVAKELGISLVAAETLSASAHQEEVDILPQLEGALTLSVACKRERKNDALITTTLKAIESLFSQREKSAENSTAVPMGDAPS